MIKNTQGFIALTSVLILSAIFLSVTISVAYRAVTVSGTSTAFRERDTARYLAQGCLEYARMELERTLDYQGNEGILIGEETCQILGIEGFGNTDRVVKVKSTVGSHTYYIEDTIEEVSPNMIVTSSERVTEF